VKVAIHASVLSCSIRNVEDCTAGSTVRTKYAEIDRERKKNRPLGESKGKRIKRERNEEKREEGKEKGERVGRPFRPFETG